MASSSSSSRSRHSPPRRCSITPRHPLRHRRRRLRITASYSSTRLTSSSRPGRPTAQPTPTLTPHGSRRPSTALMPARPAATSAEVGRRRRLYRPLGRVRARPTARSRMSRNHSRPSLPRQAALAAGTRLPSRFLLLEAHRWDPASGMTRTPRAWHRRPPLGRAGRATRFSSSRSGRRSTAGIPLPAAAAAERPLTTATITSGCCLEQAAARPMRPCRAALTSPTRRPRTIRSTRPRSTTRTTPTTTTLAPAAAESTIRPAAGRCTTAPSLRAYPGATRRSARSSFLWATSCSTALSRNGCSTASASVRATSSESCATRPSHATQTCSRPTATPFGRSSTPRRARLSYLSSSPWYGCALSAGRSILRRCQGNALSSPDCICLPPQSVQRG